MDCCTRRNGLSRPAAQGPATAPKNKTASGFRGLVFDAGASRSDYFWRAPRPPGFGFGSVDRPRVASHAGHRDFGSPGADAALLDLLDQLGLGGLVALCTFQPGGDIPGGRGRPAFLSTAWQARQFLALARSAPASAKAAVEPSRPAMAATANSFFIVIPLGWVRRILAESKLPAATLPIMKAWPERRPGPRMVLKSLTPSRAPGVDLSDASRVHQTPRHPPRKKRTARGRTRERATANRRRSR